MADFIIFRQLLGESHQEGSYEIAISLGSHALSDDGEERLLTSTCASELEWDTQINLLIRRLEELRIEGKEFLN